MSAECYFCIGDSLASMVNVETIVSQAPHIVTGHNASPMSLSGGVKRRLLSGRLIRNGLKNGAWGFGDGFLQSDKNAFDLYVFGGYVTSSIQKYVITLDDTNHYLPFQVYIDKSYVGDTYSLTDFGIPWNVRYDLIGGVLQSATKTSNYTVTTADHYLVADTSGGNITLAVNAISGFTADIPYVFYKSSSAHSLIIDPNASELIDLATTKTITAVGWTTMIKSGAAWVTI